MRNSSMQILSRRRQWQLEWGSKSPGPIINTHEGVPPGRDSVGWGWVGCRSGPRAQPSPPGPPGERAGMVAHCVNFNAVINTSKPLGGSIKYKVLKMRLKIPEQLQRT